MNDTLLQTIRCALNANGFEEETKSRFANQRWIVEFLPCHGRIVVFCFDNVTLRASGAELSTVDDKAALLHCNTRTWTRRATNTKVDAIHVLLSNVTSHALCD